GATPSRPPPPPKPPANVRRPPLSLRSKRACVSSGFRQRQNLPNPRPLEKLKSRSSSWVFQAHQIIHGLGERRQVIVSFGMMRERGENVVAVGGDDDGCVVEPIFPRARFAEEDRK